MTLPVNIDTTYDDRSAGDIAHQQHHDAVHALLNILTDTGTTNQVLAKQADGTFAYGDSGIGDLISSNNLSDLTNTAVARTNLGLGSSATQASTTFEPAGAVASGISALVGGAPVGLSTLDALAASIGDDTNFAGTVTTALAGKQPLDADLTALAAAGNSSVLTATTASFTTALQTKLNGIETGADVTDTANVTAAGALMDSEVDLDIKTLSLPANTTISTFGASLIDDIDAATARSTLGLGSAATASTAAFEPAGAAAAAVTNLIGGAPLALDTLNELAAALGDDANFATTVTNALAGKQPLDADLTALAAAGNSAVLAATTASFTLADESKLDGIEAGATADQSASELLEAIKTVDGDMSGLDADTLDGFHGADYVMYGESSTAFMSFVVDEDDMGLADGSDTKVPTQQSVKEYVNFKSGKTLEAVESAFQPLDADLTTIAAANNGTVLAGTTASFTLADESKLDGIEAGATADQTAAEILTAVKTVDGAGSGLDADTVDGIQASAFLQTVAVPGSITATGTPSSTTFLRGDGAWGTPPSYFIQQTAPPTGDVALLWYDTDAAPDALLASDYLPRLANGASVENVGSIESNVDTSSVITTADLDTSLYGVFDKTMTGDTTFTFSNPAPAGKSTTMVLRITGAFTPTLPATVQWPNGVVPTYASPSVYCFTTFDNGTTWMGSMVGAGYA